MRKLLFLLLIIIQFIACKAPADKPYNSIAKADTFIIPVNAIPIRYNYGLLLVQGKVDSVQGNFVIDTGSDWLCLDSIFQNSNLTKKYDCFYSTISGVGNSFQNITVITDSIGLSTGNNSYRTYDVPVVNLKPIGGDIVDGLIGTDYFERRIMEINYKKEYIRILNDIKSIDLSKYKKIKIKIVDYRYYVPLTVKINGSVTIKGYFFLDTGSPSSCLTSSTAENNNLKKNIEHKVRYYSNHGGIGGESSGYDFIADSLQISGFSFGNVIMSFSSDESGVLADGDYLGILGNNVLERFDILFDFNNYNLYIRPNEDYAALFNINKLGFDYADRCKTMGGWIVKGLYENSAAEKQGLMMDDKIISVNGIPVEKISYKYQKDTLPYIDNVKLLIKRAENIKTIELKLSPLL